MQEPVYVGIDVCKATLDVAIRPLSERFSIPNCEKEIEFLVDRLRILSPSLITLEATGGIELPVVAALGAAKLPVVVINPRRVRDFAKATGKLAKTDLLDAEVLAVFAEQVRPTPRPLPDSESLALNALLSRRRQLITMLTAERNRNSRAAANIRIGIQEHIDWLEERLRKINIELSKTLQNSPLWKERESLLRSVPGVGPVLTLTLLAELPELGTLDK
jgi:transposase